MHGPWSILSKKFPTSLSTRTAYSQIGALIHLLSMYIKQTFDLMMLFMLLNHQIIRVLWLTFVTSMEKRFPLRKFLDEHCFVDEQEPRVANPKVALISLPNWQQMKVSLPSLQADQGTQQVFDATKKQKVLYSRHEISIYWNGDGCCY